MNYFYRKKYFISRNYDAIYYLLRISQTPLLFPNCTVTNWLEFEPELASV